MNAEQVRSVQAGAIGTPPASKLDDLCPRCTHQRFWHRVVERDNDGLPIVWKTKKTSGCDRCACREEFLT